ncbi:MAG: hypothetical protein HN796_11915, partial [Gemmatimonadetes bacterium]|nr:hypothetical protein [Gemmatimonadota bacterium]
MTEAHEKSLVVRVELDSRINFASQQNDVPVVKSLKVENETDESLQDVEVRITGEPNFCEPWSTRIATVPAGGIYSVPAVDLQLSGRYLGGLSERIRGALSIQAVVAGEECFRSVEPVELLARDEWAGQASLPELLAAFVLPNNPNVAVVLREA